MDVSAALTTWTGNFPGCPMGDSSKDIRDQCYCGECKRGNPVTNSNNIIVECCDESHTVEARTDGLSGSTDHNGFAVYACP